MQLIKTVIQTNRKSMGTWQTVYEVMIADANRESDRGCALVLAANLDNRLQALLESFFIEQPKSKRNAIFKGNGCLSTFSSRIKIAFAVGLLGDDERHDLDIIRDIRNDFAHDESSIGFSTRSVRDRCNSMRLYQNMKSDRPEIDFSQDNSRSKFQITSVSLCLMLEDRAKGATEDRRLVPTSRSILPKIQSTSG